MSKTKKALGLSILSMMLCIVMLAGSTFAWFTDSASAGKNRIVAGNLDVELEYRDADGNWQKVDKNTSLFSALEEDGKTENLWEPGHTEVVYLKVSNVGNLALKYKLAVTVANESVFENALGDKDARLSDYLVLGQAVSDTEIDEYKTRADAWAAAGDTLKLESYTKVNNLLKPDEAEYIALIVYLPTTVGNEANYRGSVAPEITFGVTLQATQTPFEEDSFEDDYDGDAADWKDKDEEPGYKYFRTPIAGTWLNAAIKKTANGTTSASINTVDNTIKSITFCAYDKDVIGADWEDGTPADKDSAETIRIFTVGDRSNVYICVQPDTQIVLNEDSNYLFMNMQALTTIDFGGDLVSASNVTSMFDMFYACHELRTESLRQVESWDVSGVTDMGGMFRGCRVLTEIDLSNWNTASLKDVSNMFMGDTALTNVDMSGWDVSKVTDMSSMFGNCHALTSVKGLSTWSADSITAMDQMFHSCNALTELDLSGFNTSRVTSLSEVFYGCKALETLVGLENWDTRNVKTMKSLFSSCMSLTELDLPGFVTSSVTNISAMFASCKSLPAVTGLDTWDTSKVTDMGYLFADCVAMTEIDLTGWDTSKVTVMTAMFETCDNLKEITLTGWTVKSGTKTTYMFCGCGALERIYTDRDWELNGESSCMFYECRLLKGGNGTAWSRTYQDYGGYARIDRSGKKGYFTDISQKP